MGSNPTHPTWNESTTFSRRIIELGFWLKSRGYVEETIRSKLNILKILASKTDLSNPDAIFETIGNLKLSNG
ncbi:MAG: hypothetical protein ABIH76_09140, partial [Candidatus Bathyarchaeota archaeon]